MASVETRPSKFDPRVTSYRVNWRQDGRMEGETAAPAAAQSGEAIPARC